MTTTLPALKLKKTQDVLYFINQSEEANYFISPVSLWETKYQVNHININEVHDTLKFLSQVKDAKDVPYAVIADYNILSNNNFDLVKKLRSNKSLNNLPIIGIALNNEVISVESLKQGIDDVYTQPIDWVEVKKNIDFLHHIKPMIHQETNKDGFFDSLYRFYMPIFKRTFDVTASLSGLILLSPILLATAIAIKLEDPKGSIIYKSKRAGMGYKVFEFLKFRSMFVNADKKIEEMKKNSQYGAAGTFVKFTNDPRVTRVGKFIRKTSIDELPQLINILRGDMSIVGNRPLPLYEAELLTKDDWSGRFLAPAGLTGLWQVSKRGKAEMSDEERVDLDCAYAKDFSFWSDMKIVFKTIPAMVQEENV
jgi:lipopolysaccharide/colanic/teichoic acid biosynthesis glycosyltransferase